MSEFIVEKENAGGRCCFFEDDGETGYFYVYRSDGAEILDHLHIYNCSEKIGVEEGDVEVVWSRDGDKCGVKVWGNFYGIFDLDSETKLGCIIENRQTLPLQDTTMLSGF